MRLVNALAMSLIGIAMTACGDDADDFDHETPAEILADGPRPVELVVHTVLIGPEKSDGLAWDADDAVEASARQAISAELSSGDSLLTEDSVSRIRAALDRLGPGPDIYGEIVMMNPHSLVLAEVGPAPNSYVAPVSAAGWTATTLDVGTRLVFHLTDRDIIIDDRILPFEVDDRLLTLAFVEQGPVWLDVSRLTNESVIGVRLEVRAQR